MDLKTYLTDICHPSVSEFKSSPTSYYRAWVATIALFHFCDWYSKAHNVKLEDVKSKFISDFPHFKAIEDIANANKHFELDRKGNRKGLSAEHFPIGRGAAFSDGSYFSDGSTFSDAPNVIRMEFQGERIDVLHLCKQTLTYLEGKA